VLAARLGDTVSASPAGPPPWVSSALGKGDIAKRQYADKALVPVHDRQATNLLTCHVEGNLVGICVLKAVLHVRCHYLLH
jgi:hypothetical protein